MKHLWLVWTNAPEAVHVAVVGVIFLTVTALINRFAPNARARIRRVLTVFAFYALGALLSSMVGADAGQPSRWLDIITGMFEAFTLIHLGAIVIFDLFLPWIGLRLPRLTSDLSLGAAYALTGAAVLSSAGVDFTSVVAASTVFAAILTISLQTTLGNVVGGVAVQLDGSIQPGQWLQLDSGKQGKVREVRWRSTTLETRDGDSMVIPNSVLLTGQFTILGRRDGVSHPHRMWVYFQVDFRYGPAEVCRVVEEAIRGVAIPNVALEPGADCICLDLAKDLRDSYGYYAARYWIVDLASDEPTSSRVRARIHAALRRAGIPLARPSVTQFMVGADEETDNARSERRRQRAAATLRALDLFRALTDHEIGHLASDLVFAPFAAGETITRQGAVAHFLYIMQKGTAEVRVSVDTEQKLVATLAAPSFFGEMGLMTGEPRLASVIALTDVVCYRLDKQAFDSIIRARPEIAAEVSKVLAGRRVELISVREGLDAAARRAREVSEQARIVASIRSFFGLDH